METNDGASGGPWSPRILLTLTKLAKTKKKDRITKKPSTTLTIFIFLPERQEVECEAESRERRSEIMVQASKQLLSDKKTPKELKNSY